MDGSLDDIMQRVTLPELIDLIREVLDEIEGRCMLMEEGEGDDA